MTRLPRQSAPLFFFRKPQPASDAPHTAGPRTSMTINPDRRKSNLFFNRYFTDFVHQYYIMTAPVAAAATDGDLIY